MGKAVERPSRQGEYSWAQKPPLPLVASKCPVLEQLCTVFCIHEHESGFWFEESCDNLFAEIVTPEEMKALGEELVRLAELKMAEQPEKTSDITGFVEDDA